MDVRSIVVNSDTNYIIGLLVVIFSTKLLHDKSNGSNVNRKSKNVKIVENILFLFAIIVIGNYNLTLAGILTILFLAKNA